MVCTLFTVEGELNVEFFRISLYDYFWENLGDSRIRNDGFWFVKLKDQRILLLFLDFYLTLDLKFLFEKSFYLFVTLFEVYNVKIDSRNHQFVSMDNCFEQVKYIDIYYRIVILKNWYNENLFLSLRYCFTNLKFIIGKINEFWASEEILKQTIRNCDYGWKWYIVDWEVD